MLLIVMKCDACGKEHEVSLRSAAQRRVRAYCSESCRLWLIRNPGAERYSRKVIENCERCGTKIPDERRKNGKAIYCSKECSEAAYQESFVGNDQKRAHRNATSRAWMARNPDKRRHWRKNTKANRRAKRRLSAHATEAEKANRLEEYNGYCAFCGIRPHEEWEHYIPLSRGGTDTIENLFPSCWDCNRGPGGKHSKLPLFEWVMIS